MNIIRAHNLACPVDGVQLEFSEKQLVCGNGHVFDIARQGYVNLLLVQHKRSKQPGDSKDMVMARTRFLNSGTYEPVASRLADIVLEQIALEADTAGDDICVMDAGCGEGYYLDTISRTLADIDVNRNLSLIGLDISKPAIVEAAKRNKKISWIVGTNRQPPVNNASVDIILCVFGFQSFEGFSKVLKPGGKIILLEPGSEHLKELREIIYTEIKKSEPQDLAYLETMGLSITNSQSLEFKTGDINNEKINDLLLMTPHFFRASKQGREVATHLKKLDLTVDIIFRTLKKQVNHSEHR